MRMSGGGPGGGGGRSPQPAPQPMRLRGGLRLFTHNILTSPVNGIEVRPRAARSCQRWLDFKLRSRQWSFVCSSQKLRLPSLARGLVAVTGGHRRRRHGGIVVGDTSSARGAGSRRCAGPGRAGEVPFGDRGGVGGHLPLRLQPAARPARLPPPRLARPPRSLPPARSPPPSLPISLPPSLWPVRLVVLTIWRRFDHLASF